MDVGVPQQPSEKRRDWRAPEHLALTISVTVIVLFAIHLLVVAHGSAETAVALLQNSNPTTVLMPLAATLLATTLAGAVAFVGPSILGDPRQRPAWANPVPVRTAAWVACFIPAFFLVPWELTAVWILVTPLWLWAGPSEARAWAEIERKAAEGDEGARKQVANKVRFSFRSWPAWFLFLFSAYVAVAVASDVPWLPAERIATPTTGLTGYVVSDSPSSLVVLMEHRRTVVRIPLTKQVTRTFCTLGREPTTFADLTIWRNDTPKYPECKKLRP